MFHNITAVLGDVQAGRLWALAVTGPRRALVAPGLPTMDEAALRGYGITSWFGVMAPAGIAPEIIARLNRDFVRIMQMRYSRKTREAGIGSAGGIAGQICESPADGTR